MSGTHESKIADALKLIYEFGGVDGAHHKQWLLDQTVRALTDGDGPEYEKWVEKFNFGADGPDTYLWEEGRSP